MNTSAIILMTLVWVPVISLTVYFFVRIVKTPKKNERDASGENADRNDSQ